MKIVKETAIYPIIKKCYSEDPELIENFSFIAGSSLERVVKYNCEDIKTDRADFYTIRMNDEIVAFFASSVIMYEDMTSYLLNSFFIRPKYRKKISDEIWDTVNHHFDNEIFIIGINKKNIRAEKFFDRKCSSNVEFFSDKLNKDVKVYIFNGV